MAKAKPERVQPERVPMPPMEWIEGDPGYVPVTDPPESFFHVVVLPDGDEKMALIIQLAYEQGRQIDLLPGRRYLVNAKDEAEARALVEPIEKQIAENDPEHIARFGGAAFQVGLVVVADPYIHARRDPDPADLGENWSFDADRADARRARAMQAGIA